MNSHSGKISYAQFHPKSEIDSIFKMIGTCAESILRTNNDELDYLICEALTKQSSKHDLVFILKMALHSTSLQLILYRCCALLHFIDTSGCVSIKVFHPSFPETNDLEDEELGQLTTKHSHNVLRINLDNCRLISDRAIIKISQHCKNLVEFSIK